MVEGVRTAEEALGQVRHGFTANEAESRKFRPSLFVVQPVKAGDLFSAENVRSIRPAAGLPPKDLPRILVKRGE